MFVGLVSWVMADCESSVQGNNFLFGNKDQVNHEIIVDDISEGQQCDWSFIGNVANGGYISFIDESGNNTYTSSQCVNIIDQVTFNTEALINQMRLNPFYTAPSGILNYNGGQYFTIKIVYYHGSTSSLFGLVSEPVWYEYYITVFHAEKVEFIMQESCANVDYSYSSIVNTSSVPSTHQSISLQSSEGDNLDISTQLIQFTPTFTGYIVLEYSAVAHPGPSGNQGSGGAIVVYKEHQVSIGNLFDSHFTSVAHVPGPLLSSSPSTLMSSYIYTNGGQVEYAGSGVEQLGGQTYFNPSLASNGQNLVAVRSVSNGCLSPWRDTVFYITPTVVGFSKPVWDVGYTFSGDAGSVVTKNISGSVENVGVFHYGCSGETYNFKPNNHVSGLTLEYKIVFHDNLITTGNAAYGTDIQFTMPTSVNTNVQSSIYNFPALLLAGGMGGSLPYNLMMESIAGDLNSNGMLDAQDIVYSNNLGDELKIIGRYFNVMNEYSDWSTIIVGVAPKPFIEPNSLLCFDGDPVLSPVTNSLLYHDSIDYNSYRSVLWDVNMDGINDLDGSTDDVLYTLWNNTQKNYDMASIVVDSLLTRAYSPYLGDYIDFYKNGTGKVCYSNYDTVSVVRNPEVIYNIDTVGIVSLGDYVNSQVTGSWFNPVVDTIIWQWSDGSPEYSGGTNIHVMNDLGYYSLYSNVKDQYGCVSDTFMVSQWYVSGVLDVLEEEYEDVSVYPVPVENILTINTVSHFVSANIVNVNGTVVGRITDNVVDFSVYGSGIYMIEVETEKGLFIKKVIKL